MLWNREFIPPALATGQQRAALTQSLRVDPRHPFAAADAWTLAGGPLDAPELLALGGHASCPSFAYPGRFSGSSTVTRAGCWS